MKAKNATRFAVVVAVIIVAINLLTRPARRWELSRAAEDGDLSAVKRCVWFGVNINATPVSYGGDGLPALVAAAGGGHDAVVLFLLDHGGDINKRDSCGNTALNAAVIRGHLSTAQLLLSRGANPKLRGEGSPLFWAVERGDTKLAELLKSHGATK